MGTAVFYHLTRSSAEETLATILPRALGQGWRVMIRSPDRGMLEQQDQRLWLYPEEGFLPHGLEGGPHDAEQPVLLGAGAAVNGARALLLMGPQEVPAEEARALERVWLVFDGASEAQVQAARVQWKAVTAAGLAAQYWNDESGRWEKKAESAAKE